MPPILGDQERFALTLIKESLPFGRFAVAPNVNDYVFLRFHKPKTGNLRGWTLLQQQAAERWMTCYSWGPDGKLKNAWRHLSIDVLQLLIADYQTAAYKYTMELGECARCGIQLTVEDSRENGVGPECIKHWPWMAEKMREMREDDES